MPHLVISCIDQTYLEDKAQQLITELSQLIETDQKAFVLELNTNIPIINYQPICLVKWLPRPHMQLETAQLITKILDVDNLHVIFQNYDKAMYYVNGQPK